MILYFISSLAFILLSAAFTIWQIDKSRQREQAAYNDVISALLTDKKDLLDRWFMSKGHLPTGVDVNEQVKEKVAAQKAAEKRKDNSLPRAGNQLDAARNAAISQEAEKLNR